MRIQAYTHEDLFGLARAIVNSVTGIDYPFSERTYHRAVAQVQALIGANASMESIRTVKGGSLEGLKGQLLERRALQNSVTKYPATAARASGRFIPVDPGGSGSAILIQPNTIVIREATATQKEVAFRTEANAVIQAPGGVIDTSSNLIFLTCTDTGDRGNGLPTSTQLKLRNPINGVSHFLTEVVSAGGYERESDPSLRTRARLAKRGHGESTWAGLENLLTTVELSSGNRVIAAKVFEAFDEPAPLYTGIVYAIIDDGTGDDDLIGPIDATTYGPYDNFSGNPYWSYTATTTQVYLQLPEYPLELWNDGVNAGIRKNIGLPLVEGTDYWVDSDRGVIAFATPLVIGDTVDIQFNFYTLLVSAAAKYVNGVVGSETQRGWRPTGYSVRIRPPFAVRHPSVTATIKFGEGWDSTFGRAAGQTAVLAYLNGLPIGDPARYDVIVGILHKLPGVEYVANALLDGDIVDVPPTHKYGVVRGNVSTIAF